MSNHVWFRIEGRTIAQRCFCTCPTMRGRRFGYCKDFYGRKHELPDKIFNEIYKGGYKPPFVETPNNICIPCPEVKKEDPIESVNLLKGFMIKHIIPSGTDIVIKSVAKKSKYKTIVNTDYKCNTCNKTSTSFNKGLSEIKLNYNRVMNQKLKLKGAQLGYDTSKSRMDKLENNSHYS